MYVQTRGLLFVFNELPHVHSKDWKNNAFGFSATTDESVDLRGVRLDWMRLQVQIIHRL